MPNFIISDPVDEFRMRLVAELPELVSRIEHAQTELHSPSSVYWYLSFVLRPYTHELFEADDQHNLRRVWTFWESFAERGSDSERDELWSAIEEFEPETIESWLGPHLRTLIARRTIDST